MMKSDHPFVSGNAIVSTHPCYSQHRLTAFHGKHRCEGVEKPVVLCCVSVNRPLGQTI